MPKPEPLQFETTYHIYNRDNNREILFRQPENYRYFLQLYLKHFHPYVRTYAYCLLPNHFHFCVSIRSETEIKTLRVLKTLRVSTPSQAFGNLCNAYTKAINKRFERTGSLFENPFGRKRVENAAYFKNLIIYIHQNPQTHGIVDDFKEWPFSSYQAFLSEKDTRMDKTAVFNHFNCPESFHTHHRAIIDIPEIAYQSTK